MTSNRERFAAQDAENRRLEELLNRRAAQQSDMVPIHLTAMEAN